MNLIIFDIDGTLTETTEVDSKCFVQAVKDVLQVTEINTNWMQYQYSTDSGVTDEIYETLLKRKASDDEIQIIKDSFVAHLKRAWKANPLSFSPIPGADKIFAKISNLSHWHICIATGTWKQSALFKLMHAAIPHTHLAKAYADDHIKRTEIIKIAVRQAQVLHQIPKYERLIYVGDRDWDYFAAKELNMEFIGIGKAFVHASNFNLKMVDYEAYHDLLSYLA